MDKYEWTCAQETEFWAKYPIVALGQWLDSVSGQFPCGGPGSTPCWECPASRAICRMRVGMDVYDTWAREFYEDVYFDPDYDGVG